MELQHCIAWSGVMVAPQSTAYVARLTASTARKIGLANRIIDEVRPPRAFESTLLPYHQPLCPTSYPVELRFGKTCFVRQRDWCLYASPPAVAGNDRSFTTENRRCRLPIRDQDTSEQLKKAALSP